MAAKTFVLLFRTARPTLGFGPGSRREDAGVPGEPPRRARPGVHPSPRSPARQHRPPQAPGKTGRHKLALPRGRPSRPVPERTAEPPYPWSGRRARRAGGSLLKASLRTPRSAAPAPAQGRRSPATSPGPALPAPAPPRPPPSPAPAPLRLRLVGPTLPRGMGTASSSRRTLGAVVCSLPPQAHKLRARCPHLEGLRQDSQESRLPCASGGETRVLEMSSLVLSRALGSGG